MTPKSKNNRHQKSETPDLLKAEGQPHATRQIQRRVVLALAHAVACFGLLWSLSPDPGTNLQTVEGIPSEYRGDGRLRSTTIQVADVVLSCHPDPLGSANSCPTPFLPGVQAKATYFRMRTIMSTLGNSVGTAILVKLEQDKKIVLSYTLDEISVRYQWRSLFLVFIFLLSYISFLKLKFFKKTH